MRSYYGYDKDIRGQMWMSGTNMISGNGASSMTWQEPSGNKWQRGELVRILEQATRNLNAFEEQTRAGNLTQKEASREQGQALSTLHIALTRSGNAIHPLHLFMQHPTSPRGLWRRLMPLFSVVHAFWRQSLPQRTDTHFFANLFQMIHGGWEASENLSTEQVRTLLAYTATAAEDPRNIITLRPLVETLLMARSAPASGRLIDEFYRQRPWVLDLLGMSTDPNSVPIVSERYRRRARVLVRRRLKTSFALYEKRVLRHNISFNTSLLRDLFSVPQETDLSPLESLQPESAVPPQVLSGRSERNG
jgi:hypothetical protein